jgi:hypothetical protein
MKKILGLAAVVSLLVAAPAWAGGSVKILSPENGATVGQNVTLKVKVTPGDGLEHYHLFVDNEFQKAVMSEETSVKLPPGKHMIKAWGASSSHKLLDVSDEIEVTVH